MPRHEIPKWVTQGKTIRQLIEELQSFADQDAEVRISIDYAETHRGISVKSTDPSIPYRTAEHEKLMVRYFLIAMLWITVAFNSGSGLRAQEPGLSFRFDSKRTLSFRSDVDGKNIDSISPDGTMRVAVEFQKIRVLSESNDTVLHEFTTPNRAMAPTFSPDQRSIVFADCTGNLACESRFYVYQLEGGNQDTLGSCLGVTTQIVFSANGKCVAAVSMYDPILALTTQQQLKKHLGGEIVVFDLQAKSELLHMALEIPDSASASQEATSQIVDQIALDSDGMTLLVIAKTGVVKIIDVKTGAVKISITAPVAGRSNKN